MDLTIVNTALPTIGRELHFSQTSLLWVVTAKSMPPCRAAISA
jgi:hypothetical protein